MLSPKEDQPLDPEAAAVFSKVRRIMLVSTILTGIAIASVLAVVGFRVYKSGDAPKGVADVTAAMPAGARVVSTAVTSDRIAVTIEAAGKTEVLLYDLYTLQSRGKLSFAAP